MARALLRQAMEAQGFTVTKQLVAFDSRDGKKDPIGNMRFAEIDQAAFREKRRRRSIGGNKSRRFPLLTNITSAVKRVSGGRDQRRAHTIRAEVGRSSSQ